MPRQTEDQPITTRAARERLAARAEPYWRSLDAGAAIGYRKARKGNLLGLKFLPAPGRI